MQHKALYLMPLRVTLFIPFYPIHHSKKHVISQQSQQVWDPGSNAKDDFAIKNSIWFCTLKFLFTMTSTYPQTSLHFTVKSPIQNKYERLKLPIRRLNANLQTCQTSPEAWFEFTWIYFTWLCLAISVAKGFHYIIILDSAPNSSHLYS